MQTVLLAGASGHLGCALAQELYQRNYRVRALIRDATKAARLNRTAHEVVIGDATRPETLREVGRGVDIVVSALGKSLALDDDDPAGFMDVDLRGNLNLLDAVRDRPLQKFLYVSAYGTEYFPDVVYFRAHRAFAEALAASGVPCVVVKPVVLYASFLELIELGGRRPLRYLGDGAGRTNPIWEGDVARICVDALNGTAKVIEAGGEEVYTHKDLIRKVSLAAGARPPRPMPFWLARATSVPLRFSNRNLYDKLARARAVAAHDLIAPRRGTFPLERYFVQQVNRNRTVTG
ncbi:MAG: NAD(P)H-binding protein [Catalinimonas sp.]